MARPVTLVEFLLARIQEDEEAARKTPGPYWDCAYRRTIGPPSGWQITSYVLRKPEYVAGFDAGSTDLAETPEGTAEFLAVIQHAARWEPQRVLDECKAKRRIVEAEMLREVGPASHYVSPEVHAQIAGRASTPVLRLLAVPYVWHPEYDHGSWAA